MNRVEKWLHDEGTLRRPVDERVAELLENVRRGSQRFQGESWDQANERHARNSRQHSAFSRQLLALGLQHLHAIL